MTLHYVWRCPPSQLPRRQILCLWCLRKYPKRYWPLFPDHPQVLPTFLLLALPLQLCWPSFLSRRRKWDQRLSAGERSVGKCSSVHSGKSDSSECPTSHSHKDKKRSRLLSDTKSSNGRCSDANHSLSWKISSHRNTPEKSSLCQTTTELPSTSKKRSREEVGHSEGSSASKPRVHIG